MATTKTVKVTPTFHVLLDKYGNFQPAVFTEGTEGSDEDSEKARPARWVKITKYFMSVSAAIQYGITQGYLEDGYAEELSLVEYCDKITSMYKLIEDLK